MARRVRLSIDIDVELRRRLRVAAAAKDLPIGRWCLEAILERLEEEDAREGMAALADTAGSMSWEEFKAQLQQKRVSA